MAPASATDKESSTESDASSASNVDHTLSVRPWRRKVTPWADILHHEYKGAGTDDDPYVVSWLPDDHENPLTYGFAYKWSMTMLGGWFGRASNASRDGNA